MLSRLPKIVYKAILKKLVGNMDVYLMDDGSVDIEKLELHCNSGSIAIGRGAVATNSNSIAIGISAIATPKNRIIK